MKQKRFVAIAEYQRMTGLSYPTVKRALETGELRGIRTESGFWKVDTAADANADIAIFTQRLENLEGLLKALSRHLGVAV